MTDPTSVAMIAASMIVGLAIAAAACLKAWQGWLEIKRMELAGGRAEAAMPQAHGRIELADLKERVRKLEAIAAGIEL